MIRKIYNWRFFPWLAWFVAALTFFFGYVVRVSTSVVIEDIMRDWQISATSIGSVHGFFYCAYILMQIPVGMLLDRFSPVKLLIFSFCLCLLGNTVFVAFNQYHVACIARTIMGIGAAFSFAGAIKVGALWFKGKHLGLLSGLTQTLGMLGAACGEWGIAFLENYMTWNEIFWWISAQLFAVLILLFLFLRVPASEPKKQKQKINVWALLATVCKNPQTWINGAYAGLIFLPTTVFGELWGTQYLTKTRGFTHHTAALLSSSIFIGWAIGGLCVGSLSDWLGRRRPILMISALLSLVFISLVLYWPDLSSTACLVILVCYGISNTGLIASYAVAAEINPLKTTAISMATVNMLSILLGTCAQAIVSWLLDFLWTGSVVNGVRVYAVEVYQTSMLVVPCSLVGAFFIVFFIKETYCRPNEDLS